MNIERLKKARIWAGLTQSQAAQEAGMTKTSLCKIEIGERSLSGEELLVLSKLYQVTPEWLMDQESPAKTLEALADIRNVEVMPAVIREQIRELLASQMR